MRFYHRAFRAGTARRPNGGGSHGDDDNENGDGTTNQDRAHGKDNTTAEQRRNVTVEQRREWRRWILEEFIHATYGVVPVTHLVGQIANREPESTANETIHDVLTDTLLPALDDEGTLSYDSERELVINYGSD